jgi:hypothetical protein
MVNVPLWMPILLEEISFILLHLNQGIDDTKKEGSASHPLSSFFAKLSSGKLWIGLHSQFRGIKAVYFVFFANTDTHERV